jgi:hypothetical protein
MTSDLGLTFQTLGHVVDALAGSGSFDHEACDVLLRDRRIAVPYVFTPGNGRDASDAFYRTPILLAFWLAFVGYAWRVGLRQADPYSRLAQLRYIAPFFALLGVITLGIQLNAMAHYVEVCRRLLHAR